MAPKRRLSNALNAINSELRKRPLQEPFPEMYFSELPPDERIAASFSSVCVDQVVLETFVKKYERKFAPLQVPASLVSIISMYAFEESFTTRVIKHLNSPSSEIQISAFETVKHVVKFAADDFIECGVVVAILENLNLSDSAPDIIEALKFSIIFLQGHFLHVPSHPFVCPWSDSLEVTCLYTS